MHNRHRAKHEKQAIDHSTGDYNKKLKEIKTMVLYIWILF